MPDVWENYHAMIQDTNYQEVLKNKKDLVQFLRNLKKFDGLFCRAMLEGNEFTLRLEVKGNKHRLLHCRVGCDEFDRGADEKKKEKKVEAI